MIAGAGANLDPGRREGGLQDTVRVEEGGQHRNTHSEARSTSQLTWHDARDFERTYICFVMHKACERARERARFRTRTRRREGDILHGVGQQTSARLCQQIRISASRRLYAKGTSEAYVHETSGMRHDTRKEGGSKQEGSKGAGGQGWGGRDDERRGRTTETRKVGRNKGQERGNSPFPG